MFLFLSTDFLLQFLYQQNFVLSQSDNYTSYKYHHNQRKVLHHQSSYFRVFPFLFQILQDVLVHPFPNRMEKYQKRSFHTPLVLVRYLSSLSCLLSSDSFLFSFVFSFNTCAHISDSCWSFFLKIL